MVVQSTSNLTRTDLGFFCLFKALFSFFLKLWRCTYSRAHKPCWTVGKHNRIHTYKQAYTWENTHRSSSSSSSSCISLWVSAHLLDWLSAVKLAVDSKCFHWSPHCELLYKVAPVQGEGQIHLCVLSLSPCHSSVSHANSSSLPLVFLSSAGCLRWTGQQVKSIIPLAAEICEAIWNKCFAQVSLLNPSPTPAPRFQGADGRSRPHNSNDLSSATSAPAVIASLPCNIRVHGRNDRKPCLYVPKLWIDMIGWLISKPSVLPCESEY